MNRSFFPRVPAVLAGIAILAGLSSGLPAGQSPSNPWQAWKHRLPIVLTERNGAVADRLPIDLTFSMFAADIGAHERDLSSLVGESRFLVIGGAGSIGQAAAGSFVF